MWQFLLILPTLAGLEAKEIFYHTFYSTPLTKQDLIQQAKANTTFWCSIGIEQPCDPNEFRRLDGSCNNLEHPTYGASHTPLLTVLPPVYGKDNEPAPAVSGNKKPSSRRVRTTLISTGTRPDALFTHLATHFFVFVAADSISIQDTVDYVLWRPHCCLPKGKTDPMCTPIAVPNEDPVHRFSGIQCLNLTRPATYQISGCVRNDTTPARIISSTPLYDLSGVYGNTLRDISQKGRLYRSGLLKYQLDSKGRVYPPTTNQMPNVCVLNQLPYETTCYDTPSVGFNSLLGIHLTSLWFYRNHNNIASTLAKLNPCWSEDRLFFTARDINMAISHQIFYYEFLPLLLGEKNLKDDQVLSKTRGFRDTYDPSVLPQISIEYPYMLRWVHLMQEGRVKMYDQDGCYLKQVPLVNMTLRMGFLAQDDNIEGITQGSFRQATGKVDYTMDPDMAERVLGNLQRASDVGTSDLEKGRLSGFPPYVDYVQYCHGITVNSFPDLAGLIDADKLELLEDLYDDPRDIDLMAGTWVENPIEGGFVPPTFYCIVVDQFLRNINSDRHWYERPNRPHAFNLGQLLQIRKASISRLLCDVADSVTHIQPRGFERSRSKNGIVPCSEIPSVDLTAWKDDTCDSCQQA